MPFLFDAMTHETVKVTKLPSHPSLWLDITFDIEPYSPVWGIMNKSCQIIFQTEQMLIDFKNCKHLKIKNGDPNSVTFET